MRDAGGLYLDSGPGLTVTRQRSGRSRPSAGFDPPAFEEALVERMRSNVEEAGREWTPETEVDHASRRPPRTIGRRAFRGLFAALTMVFALGSGCDPEEEDLSGPSQDDLTGAVTVDGEPGPGAQVWIIGPRTLTVTTDGEGRFSAPDLLPGSYEVAALIDEVVCPRVPVQVQSDQTTDVTVPCTTPLGFSVAVMGGYRHPQQALSQICGKVTTDPPQPNALFRATITGQGVRPPGSGTGNLDAMGMATFALPITQRSTFKIQVTVTSGGTHETGLTTVVVEAIQGSCPT